MKYASQFSYLNSYPATFLLPKFFLYLLLFFQKIVTPLDRMVSTPFYGESWIRSWLDTCCVDILLNWCLFILMTSFIDISFTVN